MDTDQAFRAAILFLKGYWEKAGHPDEVGALLTFCHYTPGRGTADPAMWFDWLAQVKKVQTGELVPDPKRSTLKAEMMQSLDPEQAYVALFGFIEEYWNRVKRPADLARLLDLMRLAPGARTQETSLWGDWLAMVEKAGATR